MKTVRSSIFITVACINLLFGFAFHSAADQLQIKDVVKAPIDISASGIYYSSPQRAFSLDVSKDRFIKKYGEGLTIIGVKEHDGAFYYIVDKAKRSVLKVSQTNLYKTGQFFSWDSMTSLINLPGKTGLISEGPAGEGCELYKAVDAGVKLCVDSGSHMPKYIEDNEATVARVISVKPLTSNLKAETDSIILACKQQNYNFIDVDSDMDPDSD